MFHADWAKAAMYLLGLRGKEGSSHELGCDKPGFHTWGPAHPRPAHPERKWNGQGHRCASGHGRNQILPCLNLSSCVAWLFPDLPEPQCPQRDGGYNPEPVAGWDDHQG